MKIKKRSVGRPSLPKDEVKVKVTPVRLKGDEQAAFKRAAQNAGLSLSEWIRQTLNGAIQQ